jgi:hypothetical protein
MFDIIYIYTYIYEYIYMEKKCQSSFLFGTALHWGNGRRADGEALADGCSGVARGIQSIGAATHLGQGEYREPLGYLGISWDIS